jgi:hypothetical protein
LKRLLFNCDQVFDVLTRGPFPTGEPEDESVEHHLRACHDCRRLAEALRPAVALMHEAVAADQALDLPEYQGSLPMKRPQQRRLSIARLTIAPPVTQPATSLAPRSRGEPRQPQALSAIRLIAASLFIAALGLLFGGMLSPNGPQRLSVVRQNWLSTPTATFNAADASPDEKGLLTLASLKLPLACVPLSHRPISHEHAAQIAAALANGSLEGLRCCTECHHAGLTQPKAAQLMATNQQNCQACHRG